jgi:hypothetical protein
MRGKFKMTEENSKQETPGTAITTQQQQQLDFYEAYARAAILTEVEGTLLKFAKGDYLADGKAVPAGTRVIARMNTLQVGWIKWVDLRPADSRMGYVDRGFVLPRRHQLGDTDEASWDTDDRGEPRDPWAFTNNIVFVEEKRGQVFTFSTSSRGGITAMANLSRAYSRGRKPGHWPIITLSVDAYEHPDRTFGRIKFPVFNIVGWTERDDGGVAADGGGTASGGSSGDATSPQLDDEIPF